MRVLFVAFLVVAMFGIALLRVPTQHQPPTIQILPNAHTVPSTNATTTTALGVECTDLQGYRYRAAKCRTP